MEIKEINTHSQGQSQSLSVNQTVDSYKRFTALYIIIISYFPLFISAPCNCFLLPFLYQGLSTTAKRSLVLIGDCDKFIDH